MLKKLKEYLKSEKKDKAVFDIIIYGSAVKGKEKARDVDILVIFLDGSLRERLDKLQKIKSDIKNLVNDLKDLTLDIKQIQLKELFSSEFFARTGIFLEGVSVFKDNRFSELFGFRPFTLFWYSLKNLTHSQKVKFNYILSGRGAKGVIEELGGDRFVNGAVKIPIEHSLIFEEILKANNVHYFKKNILEEI